MVASISINGNGLITQSKQKVCFEARFVGERLTAQSYIGLKIIGCRLTDHLTIGLVKYSDDQIPTALQQLFAHGFPNMYFIL